MMSKSTVANVQPDKELEADSQIVGAPGADPDGVHLDLCCAIAIGKESGDHMAEAAARHLERALRRIVREEAVREEVGRLRSAARDVLNHFHELVPLEEGEAAHICAHCGGDWPKHQRGCVIGRLSAALAPAPEGER